MSLSLLLSPEEFSINSGRLRFCKSLAIPLGWWGSSLSSVTSFGFLLLVAIIVAEEVVIASTTLSSSPSAELEDEDESYACN